MVAYLVGFNLCLSKDTGDSLSLNIINVHGQLVVELSPGSGFVYLDWYDALDLVANLFFSDCDGRNARSYSIGLGISSSSTVILLAVV